jgi:cobalt-zinc-cadmium efflux system membrane fusion protein
MANSFPTRNEPSGSSSVVPAHQHTRGTVPALAAAVTRSLPTFLVLVCLAAVAFYGHRTGWKAPKFSDLFGTGVAQEKEDWCVEHGVPDSKCIKCHPELAGESGADWCKEHGVPESRCTTCHPEILSKGVAGDWCREHGVPESNCTKCHPEIAVKGSPQQGVPDVSVVAATGATASTKQTGSAGAGRPPKDPATCQTHAMRVQFASAASVEKAGVKLGSVVERPMADTLTANAEIDYDRTRLAQVSSRASGVAWWVGKEVGDRVTRGEVIALVDSAEIGRAKAELLQAAAQRHVKTLSLERTRSLISSKIATQAELQENEAALREAEIRLFNSRQALINLGFVLTPDGASDIPNEQELQLLGVPESVRQNLDATNTTANLLPITAPLDGVVTARNVVAGEAVETSKPLFVVADTSRMWVMIDVPQSLANRVTLGQRVRFRVEPTSDDAAVGAIAWVCTAVDEQTRTVKVRADMNNADGRLLAKMFGQATITIRESPTAIAVPDEAVQWEGCCHLVFVRLTDEIFQPRKIKLGARSGGFTEVLVGVLPGEVIATTGSHVLKSEILKSSLGAGCTDD